MDEATLTQAPANNLAGKMLGRYEIERELGRGGMGVVYLARDKNLGRRVALKTTTIMGSNERARNQRRTRFIREVRALAQVNHSNVVHVYDADEADDPDLGWLLYYSMEYVEGFTLAELVQKKGALTPEAAAAVCSQVAAGLGAAHAVGIVHRDVKPANVFITHAGRALIGDFGICKIEGSTQITRRDQLIGTPNYLAPEQILGDPISAGTDVFAVGALYYVIATNSPLRKRLDAASLLKAAQEEGPYESMMALQQVPLPLRQVLAKSLRRLPEDRQPSCATLSEELAEFAGRIPTLDDAPAAPAPIDTPPPPAKAVPAPLGNISSSQPGQSVEDVAKALLQEFGAPKKETKDEAPAVPDSDDLPLPEAQVESTVMFNMRNYEQERAQRQGEDETPAEPEIMVAQTESTVMFNMRQLEEQEMAKRDAEDAQALEAVSSSSLSSSEGAAASFDDAEPSLKVIRASDGAHLDISGSGPNEAAPGGISAPMKAAPASSPTTPSPTTEVAPAAAPTPAASAKQGGKGKLIAAAVAVVVLIAGAAGAFVWLQDQAGEGGDVGVPQVVEDAPKEAPVDDVQKAAPAPLPKLCNVSAKDAKMAARAPALLKDAETLLSKGSYAKAHSKVAKALVFAPQSPEAHSLMAKVLVKRKEYKQALEHYRCVVGLAPPDTKMFKVANKAVQRANK